MQVPVMGSWNIADDNKVAMLSAQSIASVVNELGANRTMSMRCLSPVPTVPLVDQLC